ncbi:tautomerase family protein [Kitasatospora sp. RG8]|nr:tautomerase family protein [Kitasatospora sp. RG8]MBP0450374.1 tautomerase family protein [Kitasatospora sp. RG8]
MRLTPARLIAATTDALAAVLGEEARGRTVVTIEGVPAGRSGVGGQVA